MRRTVRLRLTALYGSLFLLCGAALLAITYLLVIHSTNGVYTYRSKDGRLNALLQHAGTGKPAAGSVLRGQVSASDGGDAAKLPQPDQLLALAKQQHASTMHQLLLDSAIALGVMAVLAIGLGWLVAGRVLRPLRTITGTAREISATNLHRRLALSGPRDELTELGDTFDALLTRLEKAFHAQRQFVANASHELRTPLARQRAIGQVALADPEASVDSLRAAHQRVLVAGAQQERLIVALLALARGQAGVVRPEPLDLAELAARALATRQAEAELRGIVVDACLDPARVTGDPRLLESLVANLVDNALRHNAEQGRVEVCTGVRDGRASLSVTNTGPVVPPDELPRLLEPFHRLSPDRGAHGDGLGIGLSVVQAVSEAHDAELEVRCRPRGGLVIEVRFAVLEDAAPPLVQSLQRAGDD